MSRIPFAAHFVPLIQDGRKTCTCRTKRYGVPGSVLDSAAGRIRLTEIRRVTLETVRDFWWKREGVNGPEDFVVVWNTLHPYRRFNSKQLVWLHVFEFVG